MSPVPRTLGLLALAGVRSLPVVSALPGIGGRRAADLADLTLVLEHVRIDRERLAAYDRVCGFPLRDRLPATYPHTLAFALQLELLSDPTFPLAPVGLVHVRNRIVQHRAIDASEELVVSVRAADLRPHRRGRQFDLISEVRVDGEVVWEEVSTNLRIDRRGEEGEREPAGGAAPAEEQLRMVARWQLAGDLGRRYAAVSGDYNPIHIHPLSARLLGFPAAIAHGMWTQARSLAALGSLLPDRCVLQVAFKRPIVLPARVEFLLAPDGDGDLVSFAVRDARKLVPHLEGTARPL